MKIQTTIGTYDNVAKAFTPNPKGDLIEIRDAETDDAKWPVKLMMGRKKAQLVLAAVPALEKFVASQPEPSKKQAVKVTAKKKGAQ